MAEEYLDHWFQPRRQTKLRNRRTWEDTKSGKRGRSKKTQNLCQGDHERYQFRGDDPSWFTTPIHICSTCKIEFYEMDNLTEDLCPRCEINYEIMMQGEIEFMDLHQDCGKYCDSNEWYCPKAIYCPYEEYYYDEDYIPPGMRHFFYDSEDDD